MKNIKKEEFAAEVLGANGKVLVDFWASWCGPCRAQSPILEELAALRPDIKIVKVNVDAESELASEYGVMSIPTLALFDGGEQVKTAVGLHTLEELKKLVD